MASPGWYPDPAGQPGAFRFFNGAEWSSDLANTPYGPPPGQVAFPPPPPPAPSPAPPPPGPAAPQGFASYAGSPPGGPGSPGGLGGGNGGAYDAPGSDWSANPQPGWGPTPSPPPPPSPTATATATSPSGSGRGVLLALVAILAAVALGVVTFLVVEAVTDDGSSTSSRSDSPRTDLSAQDPAQDPTQEPAPSTQPSSAPSTPSTPSTPSPAGLQCAGGLPTEGVSGVQGRFLTGGGLKMPKVPGFSIDLDQGSMFLFADGVSAPAKLIEQNGDQAWAAVYALGGLNKANGFDDPQQAAESVLSCMASSDNFYTDLTGSEILDSAATSVDGADAWQVTAQIDIDNPKLTVTGDIATVVVVETGDPETYGLFVSVVPIGADALIAEQDEQATKLRLQ